VPHVHIHQFVYYLLELMLVGFRFKGIMITVDRPCNYVLKLLQSRGIKTENMGVIDVITSISTGSYEDLPRTKFLKSPFCIDIHTEIRDALVEGKVIPGDSLEDCRFIMFDNITVLDHYIEIMCLKRIFVQMEEITAKYPKLMTLMIMDTDRYKKVFRAFEAWPDMVIKDD
jgi:hypothetical protein